MTSIHHELDLISQVDGWGTLTWTEKALGAGDVDHTPRRPRVTGRRRLERLVALALRWRACTRSPRVAAS